MILRATQAGAGHPGTWRGTAGERPRSSDPAPSSWSQLSRRPLSFPRGETKAEKPGAGATLVGGSRVAWASLPPWQSNIFFFISRPMGEKQNICVYWLHLFTQVKMPHPPPRHKNSDIAGNPSRGRGFFCFCFFNFY